MNYADITDTALSYADREDTEVTSRIDKFLRIVEARINRFLKTQKMAVRSVIITTADKYYYGLPSGFSGIRNITLINGSSRTPGQYINPEQMDNIKNSASETNVTGLYYNFVADQLQIYPSHNNKTLEILHYQDVKELNSSQTNWISDYNPDVYIFGLLVEINAFVKDASTAAAWDQRFKEALAEIKEDDQISRWSGPPLVIRTG